MKLSFSWLCEAWPIYRYYVKQRRWRKAREFRQRIMVPVCSDLSWIETLVASGGIITY